MARRQRIGEFRLARGGNNTFVLGWRGQFVLVRRVSSNSRSAECTREILSFQSDDRHRAPGPTVRKTMPTNARSISGQLRI